MEVTTQPPNWASKLFIDTSSPSWWNTGHVQMESLEEQPSPVSIHVMSIFSEDEENERRAVVKATDKVRRLMEDEVAMYTRWCVQDVTLHAFVEEHATLWVASPDLAKALLCNKADTSNEEADHPSSVHNRQCLYAPNGLHQYVLRATLHSHNQHQQDIVLVTIAPHAQLTPFILAKNPKRDRNITAVNYVQTTDVIVHTVVSVIVKDGVTCWQRGAQPSPTKTKSSWARGMQPPPRRQEACWKRGVTLPVASS